MCWNHGVRISFFLYVDSIELNYDYSLSAAGMVLAILVGTTSLYYIIRSEFRVVRLIFGMFILSAGYTLLSLIMAMVAAIGISTTCNQFTSAGFACSTVFSGGFFETDTNSVYVKNLGTIIMSVVASWFCFAAWGAYTFLEYLNWRNSVWFIVFFGFFGYWFLIIVFLVGWLVGWLWKLKEKMNKRLLSGFKTELFHETPSRVLKEAQEQDCGWVWKCESECE
jgi:hypothetical protein